MKSTIEQVELFAAQVLDAPVKRFLQNHYPVPQGCRISVSLFDAGGRKKRRSASAENWSPESGRIEIRLELGSNQSRPGKTDMQPQSAGAPNALPKSGLDAKGGPEPDVHPILVALIKALDRAESTPGWSFVSLKKFRDEVLPLEPFDPGGFQPTDVHWREAIGNAIAKRLVLTGKVPNPKSPQFPVTTIRLNRLMPEVKAALGHAESPDLDFHPVEIKGEPLSATIIRERHR